MAVEPWQWSKMNPPTPSDILQVLRNVCSSPIYDIQSSSDQQSPDNSPPPASSRASITDTPLHYRNPSLHDLEQLSAAIDLYGCYTSGKLSLHKAITSQNSVPYLLAVHPVYPESLNTSLAGEQAAGSYHSLLRTTLLHQPDSTITLRTVALGRIWFCLHPTSWVVVMGLRGELFALRSDVVAPKELLWTINGEGDGAEIERIPAAPLPVFEKTGAKAVYLGNIKILDPSDLSISDGFVLLPSVTNWESSLVDA
jgi:hypothetical protein